MLEYDQLLIRSACMIQVALERKGRRERKLKGIYFVKRVMVVSTICLGGIHAGILTVESKGC